MIKRLGLIILVFVMVSGYGQNDSELLIKDGYILKVYSEPEHAISAPFDYLFYNDIPEINNETTEYQLLEIGSYIAWVQFFNKDLYKSNTGKGYSLFIGKEKVSYKKKLKDGVKLEFYQATIVYKNIKGKLSIYTSWEISGGYSFYKNYNQDSLYTVFEPELIIWR